MRSQASTRLFHTSLGSLMRQGFISEAAALSMLSGSFCHIGICAVPMFRYWLLKREHCLIMDGSSNKDVGSNPWKSRSSNLMLEFRVTPLLCNKVLSVFACSFSAILIEVRALWPFSLHGTTRWLLVFVLLFAHVI